MTWRDLGFKRITLVTVLRIKFVGKGEQEQKLESHLGGYYNNPTRDDANSDQTWEKWLDPAYFEGFADGYVYAKGRGFKNDSTVWPNEMER